MEFVCQILDVRKVIVIFLLFTVVHSKYISGKVDVTTSTTSRPIDCFSPDVPLDQLKAIGERKVSCKDTTRRFWISACNCSLHPDAQCPKCRFIRNVDDSVNSGNRSAMTSSYDDQEASKKPRTQQNHTTITNSANFIRFGK